MAYAAVETHEADLLVASIEVTSQDETQEMTFETHFIMYNADRDNGLESFSGVTYTTPQTFSIEPSYFVGVFKKVEDSANMRVTLTIKNGKGVNTLKCGAENCIVVIKDGDGYNSRL